MHRLILLRHAKAAWPEGIADQDRPLAGRGEDNASIAAGLFGNDVPIPDLVLCSPALRARQTWEIAGSKLDPARPVQHEQSIYGASIDDLIDLAHGLAENVGTALIVGHEPTMSRTVLALAGSSSNEAAVAQVQRKFPTCAMAVLSVDTPWAELAPGTAALDSVSVPRG
jgi:phosphohistidine phosphatase